MSDRPYLSVVLPCRNEEESLAFCLSEIKETLIKNKISGEIVVSDSSNDRSPEIAREAGVVLVEHNKDGYGNAYLEGFKVAKGKYLFLADADGTYDFREIPKFLKKLEEGNDFVIGNRFTGKMEKGAMPWLHQHLGRFIFSLLFKILFHQKDCHDIHCGVRAISREALDKLKLQTTGMEFASEMIIKAAKNNLRIAELPSNYRIRLGRSKLRSFSDGWRHLRFLLLYSPLFLFLVPGLFLLISGLLVTIGLVFDKISFLGRPLYYHPLFISSLAIIIGYQLIYFAFFAKIFAINHLGERDIFTEWLYRNITLERACLFGLSLIVAGTVFFSVVIYDWTFRDFPEISGIKEFFIAFVFVAIGTQTISSSFMLSILGIKDK